MNDVMYFVVLRWSVLTSNSYKSCVRTLRCVCYRINKNSQRQCDSGLLMGHDSRVPSAVPVRVSPKIYKSSHHNLLTTNKKHCTVFAFSGDKIYFLE
jgi:hypothetical protein